jgi:hypothetical protein
LPTILTPFERNTGIDGNSVNPGEKFRALIEILEISVDFDENLLSKVSRVRIISRESIANAVYRYTIFFEDPIKDCLIAFLKRFNEICIFVTNHFV